MLELRTAHERRTMLQGCMNNLLTARRRTDVIGRLHEDGKIRFEFNVLDNRRGIGVAVHFGFVVYRPSADRMRIKYNPFRL